MKYIRHEQICNLNISPLDTIQWVKESFNLKKESYLPHKTNIVFEESKFMNTMPVVIPNKNILGCKIVTRYPNRIPSIDGQIFIYDYKTGTFMYLLDAFWITTARTGAVCALALQTFARKDFNVISIMGLGNTALASMYCILENNKDKKLTINLLKYKNQSEKFIEHFRNYSNASFKILDNIKEFISCADVIISCITCANQIIAQPEWFKKGSLLIPVHTKGFQSCDLIFDKIFADDTEHVKGFKYFKDYKNFGEIQDVIAGKIPGRENDDERIISYNVGIAMHDIIFSEKIISLIENKKLSEITNKVDETKHFTFNIKNKAIS